MENQNEQIKNQKPISACHCSVHDSNKASEQRALLSASSAATAHASVKSADGHSALNGATGVGEEDAMVAVVSNVPHECCQKRSAVGNNARLMDDDESKLIVAKSYRCSIQKSKRLSSNFN